MSIKNPLKDGGTHLSDGVGWGEGESEPEGGELSDEGGGGKVAWRAKNSKSDRKKVTCKHKKKPRRWGKLTLVML